MPKLNEAFWKWFRNSVVRHKDGSPRVMYHGTGESFRSFDIERCELGCHFGTKSQATTMTTNTVILPCYLSIQNPLRLQDPINWTPVGVLYQEGFPATQEEINAITVAEPPREVADRMIRELVVKAGYDGIVYLNRHEGYHVFLTDAELRRGLQALGYSDVGDYYDLLIQLYDEDFKKLSPTAEDSYIAFSPWQIKSIKNDGTWDRDDPNIRSNPAEDMTVYYRFVDAMKARGWRYVRAVNEDRSPNDEALRVGSSVYPTLISTDGMVKVGLSRYDLYYHNGNVWRADASFAPPDLVTLEGLVVDPSVRRRGVGTRAVKDLFAAADESGARLLGHAAPMGMYRAKGQRAITLIRLIRWYMSLGFVPAFPEEGSDLLTYPPPAAKHPSIGEA